MTGGSINKYINRDTIGSHQFKDRHQSEQTYFEEDKTVNTTYSEMPSCARDDCGLVFESIQDLARDMNRWCPETTDLKRKRNNE